MSEIPDYLWLAGDDDGGVVVVCGACPPNGKMGIAYHCGPGQSHSDGLPYFPREDLNGFFAFINRHALGHKDWAAADPDEPNWGPLEKVLPPEECGGWMWMSRSVHDGRVIEAYKHSDTRGYVHLDQDGQAWLIEHGEDPRCMPWGCDNGHDCCMPFCAKDHQHIPVPQPTLTRLSVAAAMDRALS